MLLEATDEPDVWVAWQTAGPRYRRCANLHTPAACNWLVPVEEFEAQHGLCRACRLNRTIPDLNGPLHLDNGMVWGHIEMAKRRLVSVLLVMGQAVASRETEDPKNRLMFNFLRAADDDKPILTAHGDGLTTLNVAEADDVQRERATSCSSPITPMPSVTWHS